MVLFNYLCRQEVEDIRHIRRWKMEDDWRMAHGARSRK